MKRQRRYTLLGFKMLLITVLAPFGMISQTVNNSAKCKALAISGAGWAKRSYAFAQENYFSSSAVNRDSAVYCIEQSVLAMDSCLALATDSDQTAKSFLAMAKKSANRVLACTKSSAAAKKKSDKQEFAWRAVTYSSQTVLDAYHASFYFEGTTKESEKKPEPAEPPTEKKITKLDIDQALFALLDEKLIEKEENDKKEIAKLEAQLKATKDPAKVAKLKAEIKKIEKDEAELEVKDKEAKDKLGKINAEIEDRDKNKKTEAPAETTAFSKSLNRPVDDWNKTVLTDAELPTGLVFQVQIGVYKNPVTAETFKGITPIFGRTIPAGVCYSAGIFEKLNDAQQAKDYVISMGLHDAFVIAYNDKKRITLAEAAKLEKK